MEVRSIRYNNSGCIDCEINHKDYGWIPFTASPDDTEKFGADLYSKLVSGEYGEIAEAPPVPGKTPAEIKAAKRAEVKLNYNLSGTIEEKIEALEVMLDLRDPPA